MTLGYIDIFYVCVGIISLSKKPAGCNPITNSNFNDHIREFALKDDDFNSSNAKTLLKEDPGRYANFTPIPSSVKFKDAQDSSQSGSSYSRGLVHHEHLGHPLHEYEGPHYEHGAEYHFPEYHHGYPYGIDHHGIDHGYGHHGEHHYPDHHKYHHHGLAAKTVLWPIAGLALLGAAAALVTNPILLQIGVASGKRRRRDTEESLEPYLDVNRFSSKDSESNERPYQEETLQETLLKTKLRQRAHLLQKRQNLTQRRITKKKLSSSVSSNVSNPFEYTKLSPPGTDSDLFIPVPIKIKDGS